MIKHSTILSSQYIGIKRWYGLKTYISIMKTPVHGKTAFKLRQGPGTWRFILVIIWKRGIQRLRNVAMYICEGGSKCQFLVQKSLNCSLTRVPRDFLIRFIHICPHDLVEDCENSVFTLYPLEVSHSCIKLLSWVDFCYGVLIIWCVSSSCRDFDNVISTLCKTDVGNHHGVNPGRIHFVLNNQVNYIGKHDDHIHLDRVIE